MMINNFELEYYLKQKRKQIEAALIKRLAPKEPKELYNAMRYSVFSSGKRFRPILVLAGAELCGCDSRKVIDAACAIELVHTYSLVHDDLPALDNDDYRRGQLTCHKKFSEDIAILAGDALLTYAFELLGRNIGSAKTKNSGQLIEAVARAIGKDGMVGGQVVDITSCNRKAAKLKLGSEIEYIHLNKTAKLIELSCKLGAMMINAKDEVVNALEKYGRNIGLAFQIVDDILDCGEKNSDQINNRLTYPAVYGVEISLKVAQRYVKTAKRAICKFANASPLLMLADYVVARKK